MYQMLINNAALHILKYGAYQKESIDAFTMSTTLSICLCKNKSEIVHDIMLAVENLKK